MPNLLAQLLVLGKTLPAGLEELSEIEGKNSYKAILGANPNPYGVFWLEVKQTLYDENIIIQEICRKRKIENTPGGRNYRTRFSLSSYQGFRYKQVGN